MGEEAPDVGVAGRSNSASMLVLVGANINRDHFCHTRMGVVRGVPLIEGAIWVVVLVVPHLARSFTMRSGFVRKFVRIRPMSRYRS